MSAVCTAVFPLSSELIHHNCQRDINSGWHDVIGPVNRDFPAMHLGLPQTGYDVIFDVS